MYPFSPVPRYTSLENTEPKFGTGNARSSKEGHDPPPVPPVVCLPNVLIILIIIIEFELSFTVNHYHNRNRRCPFSQEVVVVATSCLELYFIHEATASHLDRDLLIIIIS